MRRVDNRRLSLTTGVLRYVRDILSTIVGQCGRCTARCVGGGGGSSGGSSSTLNSTPQSGNVAMLLSDASTEDWATIGVKVLSIALVPQGGGGNVTVYTRADAGAGRQPRAARSDRRDPRQCRAFRSAPIPVRCSRSAPIPATCADGVGGSGSRFCRARRAPPFPRIRSRFSTPRGSGSNLTVPVNVNFDSPLVVSANQNNALDLEFDLAHPAFLVGHVPAGAAAHIWAVNFNGPVRHHPLHDLARLVLRHTYGDVTAISSDNSSITITKEFPTEPHVNPETAIAGTQSLQILADATNGTIFYDVDAKTRTVIKNFSAESSLVGKSVRIAARYQEDGTLVATRIWASSQFNNVWLSPEGHVLHVNTTTDVITVAERVGPRGRPDGRCQHAVLLPPAAKSRRRCDTDRHRDRVPHEQGSRARLQGACQRRRSAGDTAGRAEHRHRDRRSTTARSPRRTRRASPIPATSERRATTTSTPSTTSPRRPPTAPTIPAMPSPATSGGTSPIRLC